MCSGVPSLLMEGDQGTLLHQDPEFRVMGEMQEGASVASEHTSVHGAGGPGCLQTSFPEPVLVFYC